MATLAGLPLLVTILAIAGGTVLTRALPFLIFPPGKNTPAFIIRLQHLLPSAMIGLLVVYCLRYINLFSGSRGAPEFLAIAATALIHLWRQNSLLSIMGGTVFYMLLVQLVF